MNHAHVLRQQQHEGKQDGGGAFAEDHGMQFGGRQRLRRGGSIILQLDCILKRNVGTVFIAVLM